MPYLRALEARFEAVIGVLTVVHKEGVCHVLQDIWLRATPII